MKEHVIVPKCRPIGCVIVLPGRGMDGMQLAELYKKASGLDRTIFVSFTPEERQWYPLPNGVQDQTTAVAGLMTAKKQIETATEKLLRSGLASEKNIALVGYSAGAVVALYASIHSDMPYVAAVAHSGAILEPDKLEYCKKSNLQLMMVHSRNDTCFFWEERYVPTKNALKRNGYNLACIEHNAGGHGIIDADVTAAGLFLAPLLLYPPTWRQS